MPKLLKIISMQYLCNISRKNCVTKLMFCMLINIKLFYKLILLFLIGLARHAQSIWASLQCLCDILRNVRNEVKDLTALAASNAIIAIYYTLNVHLPFKSFLSMKSLPSLFFHLINFVLLFQVTVGPCKFDCFY